MKKRIFRCRVLLATCAVFACLTLPVFATSKKAADNQAAVGAAADETPTSDQPRTLSEIKASGYLRHLGVPYANFITGGGDGLDVDLMRLFAEHLGVGYVYVRADWGDVIPGILGQKVIRDSEGVRLGDRVPVRGDLIANGLTRIPWREEVIDYSLPTFPTEIWLITRGDSPIAPIVPSGDLAVDIGRVYELMSGRSVLCKTNTCLDPSLFGLEPAGAKPVLFEGTLNELAPALIDRRADATILDLPDALVALNKWPGRIKVIGPVSAPQEMAIGFAPQSGELREAFDAYFTQLWNSGVYLEMVREYYPAAPEYFPDFFARPLAVEPVGRIAGR